MKKVCIVVPVYKENLNPFEKISLQQLLQVLGKYPICFVQPASLKIDYVELSEFQYSVLKFDRHYFQDTATYSDLMLSPFFYENFLDYQYILIYQLDSFVFSDRLSEFCGMRYDYIGAPQHHFWTDEIVVGNGGLSLRKVKSVLNMTKRYEEIVDEQYYRNLFRKWEDNFFSYCGSHNKLEFTVPAISLANTFSVVQDAEKGIQNIVVNGLPFGTHAWHRQNFMFWKNIIKMYGYHLDDLVVENNQDTLEKDRKERYSVYFLKSLSILTVDQKKNIIRELGLLPNHEYSMWGAGSRGKEILDILLDLGVNISDIFDSNPLKRILCGIIVRYPDFEEMKARKLTILISSEDYEEEIATQLMKHGCVHFIKLAGIFKDRWETIQEKYRKSFPKIEGVTVPFNFIDDNSWMLKL